MYRKLKSTGGRNNQGKITSRFRGGGDRPYIPIIVQSYFQLPEFWKILHISRNLKKTGAVALVKDIYSKKFFFIPCSTNLKPGIKKQKIQKNQKDNTFFDGDLIFLRKASLGSKVFAISCGNQKAQFSLSGGCYSRVIKKKDWFVGLQLPSGTMKWFNFFEIGFIGISIPCKKKTFSYKKAGNRRQIGIRPHVRGVAINPVDHPIGGGEGKSSGGRPSVSPWGKLTK